MDNLTNKINYQKTLFYHIIFILKKLKILFKIIKNILK